MEEVFLEDEETGYLVSNIGRVVSKRGKILNCRPYDNGYVVVGYWDSIRHVHSSIGLHRLVARNFISNPCGLQQINHKDENKANNRLDNLEWCDSCYNQRYGTTNSRRLKTRTDKGCKNACKHIILVKGEETRVFSSIHEAASVLGLRQAHLSSMVSKKKGHRSVNGWKLPEDRFFSKEKPITIIDISTGNKKEFPSCTDAARFLQCDSSNLIRILKKDNGTRSYKGWRLAQ